MNIDVLVVGSLNLDTRALVAQLPLPGETVVARTTVVAGGGKGANQAVASARAGAKVSMVGAVGDDEAGRSQINELRAHGIGVEGLRTIIGVATGSAMVVVDGHGENSIVVSPGANAYASAAVLPEYETVRVVLVQHEIPERAIADAAAFASGVGARLIVNAAPILPGVVSHFKQADPLVVNEHEAAAIMGTPVSEPLADIEKLRAKTGAPSVVITRGAKGAVVDDGGRVTEVSGSPVSIAVDTTGAGDAFVGTLAAKLAAGSPLEAAVRDACAAGGAAVTVSGARQPPSPTPHADFDTSSNN